MIFDVEDEAPAKKASHRQRGTQRPPGHGAESGGESQPGRVVSGFVVVGLDGGNGEKRRGGGVGE